MASIVDELIERQVPRNWIDRLAGIRFASAGDRSWQRDLREPEADFIDRVRADAAEAGFKTVMNRVWLLVRISLIIQYDNARRASNRVVFHPDFPPSAPGNADQIRQSPADRPWVCRPGKRAGAAQRLIHSSHQPRQTPRLGPGATLSPKCGWAGPRSGRGGRWQDDVLARKAIVGGGQSAAENSSAHDFAACSMRTPQRAGPRSARSTKPTWRRDRRLRESRWGDGR